MKIKGILTAVVLFTLCISACKDEDVKPADLQASWELKSSQLNAKFVGKDEIKGSDDFSSRVLFLNLDAAGSFQSNSLFSLQLEDPMTEQSVSGTYELKDGFLIFKYKDPGSNEDVSFYMKASTSKKNLTLTIDKDCLAKTIEVTAPEAAVILKSIEQYSLKLNYSKK